MTEPSPVRTTLPPALTRTEVVAVLRAPEASAYEPVVRTLVESGVFCIELTLTTPGTIEILPTLRRSLSPEAEIGVGTILTDTAARAAIDAGARFLVTPNTNSGVIAAARGIPVLAGAFTPSEAHANMAGGAAAVKLFPATVLGPSIVAHLHGPFPTMPLMPSGGVTLDDVPAWIEAGAVAVSLGGPLVGDAFAGGDLSALAARARRALDAVSAARRTAA